MTQNSAVTLYSHLSNLDKCPLKQGGSLGPSSALWGWKNRERERGTWWEGRRTGGVKHQVTVYIPPRRHVAQTDEHQPPSLAKFTRQGQVYYTVVLMYCLITLHWISLHILHRGCHLLLSMWFTYHECFIILHECTHWFFSFTDWPLQCFSIDNFKLT